MGRPKRPFNGQEIIEPGHDRWMSSLVPGGVGRRRGDRWDVLLRRASYRTPNGVHDPLTFLHVLSTLMTINPDIELRSANLVRYLNTQVPQFYWDTTTVGRVLADLCEYIEDVLGGKGTGLLEAGADYKGKFYRLHHNPETAAKAYALHDDLEKLYDIEKTLRDRGEKPVRLTTPLDECPSVRTGWALPEEEPVALVG